MKFYVVVAATALEFVASNQERRVPRRYFPATRCHATQANGRPSQPFN